MNVKFLNLGLYHVDTAYLRYLKGIDSEVQFSEDKDFLKSPF